MNRIASVDGCKKGWLVAMATQWPPALNLIDFSVCPTFNDVLNATQHCSTVVVDMPIGLPAQGSRDCDIEARQFLAPKGSAVFDAPPRAALSAATPQQFQNMVRQINGVGAGLPVWGIVPKLREVDAAMVPPLQIRVKEYHPEIIWRQYAGGIVLSSKHSAAGLLQRLEIIENAEINLYNFARILPVSTVKLDDLLDAVIGLDVAWKIDNGLGTKFPAVGQTDGKGLSMEIWS